MTDTERWWTRMAWLLPAVAIGVAIRAARLAAKWNEPLLLNDSLYYSAQGYQLGHGVWFTEVVGGGPGAEHGPLTPVALALVSWLDEPIAWQRLVTMLLGVATVPVIGLIGHRIGGRRVGVVAALLAAVYPNLWMNDGLVMSESLAALLVAVFVLLLLRWLDGPTTGRLAAVGVVAGLGALTRSEILLVVPLVIAGVVVAGRRRQQRLWPQSLWFAATVVLVLAPWTVFNATRFEHPVLLTTNDGGTLLGANCPEAYEGDVIGGWSVFCLLDRTPDRPYADTSARNVAQRREGIRYALDHMDRWPVVAAARLGRLVDVYDLGEQVHMDVGEERERWASWAGIAAFWVLAPLAVVGLTRLRRGQRAVLLLPIAVSVSTAVLFYGAHRMRIAAEPAVVVAAAVAVTAWVERWRGARPASHPDR